MKRVVLRCSWNSEWSWQLSRAAGMCCSSLAVVVQFQRSVLGVTGCQLGAGDRWQGWDRVTEARGPGGQLWGFSFLMFMGEMEKERCGCRGTGAGAVLRLRGGLCRAVGAALMDPQECVCALQALPAWGILNPAPIPSRRHSWPAGGDKPCVVHQSQALSQPWRSPQHPPAASHHGPVWLQSLWCQLRGWQT